MIQISLAENSPFALKDYLIGSGPLEVISLSLS